MGDADGPRYNMRSPSVKRLMQESKELREATEQYHAQPLEDNLYEWHFTIRGAPDTDFADGIYHGRIMLPADYPMKPPSIVLLTPNGRFEINKKICLSISGHHPESWQPSWSIRTALMAIIGFLPSPGKGAIGALDYPAEERKKLARRSKEWKCPVCGVENHQILKAPAASSSPEGENQELMQEFKDLARKISFKGESTSESGSGDAAVKKEASASAAIAKEASIDEEKDAPEGAAAAATTDSHDVSSLTQTTTNPASNPSSPDSVFQDASSPITPPPAPLTAAFPLEETPAVSSQSSPTAAPSSEEDGLRRRVGRLEDVAASEVAAREAANIARAATPVPPARAHPVTSTSSYYLMVLLSVTIGVLLLRRILRLIDFKFDFQFDYHYERH